MSSHNSKAGVVYMEWKTTAGGGPPNMSWIRSGLWCLAIFAHDFIPEIEIGLSFSVVACRLVAQGCQVLDALQPILSRGLNKE